MLDTKFPWPLPTDEQIRQIVDQHRHLAGAEAAVRLWAKTRAEHAEALERWEAVKPARAFFVQLTDEQRAAKEAVARTFDAAYSAEEAMDAISESLKGQFLMMLDKAAAATGSQMASEISKMDGLGNPLDDGAMYYVQDSRQVVGNCALWWCAEAKGYTCELGEAGQYSGREVRSMRTTDIPWPVGAVRDVAVQHVRSEGLARLREQRRAI